jgi:leucyl/phenylalanyl-tRNA--protein transferase
LKPNASKAALIYLSKILIDNNVSLIDCQFETPHLKSMGGRHISYDEYMKIMEGAAS